MTAAIFLDRDGTLIEDRGYLREPSEVVFYPHTVPALRRLQEHFALFIVTNQSGVALGKIRPEEAERVNAYVVERLAESGVRIRAVYCCPHDRADGCACRKPQPHFALQAQREHGVDPGRSHVVGDHPSDMEFARNVGARGLYVLSGHGEKHFSELATPCDVVPGIAEAADRILVARATEVLRGGGLAAFPTETVYGLGADAENPAAVRRIFDVKRRPTGHPLIVHLADARALADWADPVPEAAARLAERFWPGPLTLILKRRPRVPDAVTGGQDTVGLRVPAHPLAQALLRSFGGGVAAPSANRFGRVSPTTAEHVRHDLGADVEFILDGGPCAIGVESTIVDLSSGRPSLLRPGGIALEQIESVVGPCARDAASSAPRAPGGLPSHYAPRARVIVVRPEELVRRSEELRGAGLRVGALCEGGAPSGVVHIPLPASADAAAPRLYAALREGDRLGLDALLVALPREEGLGRAIADRLQRAAGPRPRPDLETA